MIPLEVVQVLIIIGNFLGFIMFYMLVERKVDRKAASMVRQAKASPEGRDVTAILKEIRRFFESGEVKKLLSEVTEVVLEARQLLKMTASTEEDEEDQVQLPAMAEDENART